LSLTKFPLIIFDIFGFSQGSKVLLISDINLFTPFLVLYPFFHKYYSIYFRIFIFLVGLSSSILIIFYNPSGKAFLIIFFVFLILFLMLPKRFLLFFIPFLILTLITIESLFLFDQLTINKFYEVFSLFRFWESNWLANLPSSPKYRVVQIINIYIEYINKPLLSFFGKGFIGTYKDSIAGFSDGFLSSFTEQEFRMGIFYYVHDAIGIIFLTHGLSGLFVLTYLLFSTFKNKSISFIRLISLQWFLFFYGFSIVISTFGAIVFFLAYNNKYEPSNFSK
jgi:hypothetical protein